MEDFNGKIVLALDTMMRERKLYKNYLSDEAETAGRQLIQAIRKAPKDMVDAVAELCKREIPRESPYMAVWWYSVLIEMKKDPGSFLEFVQYIREKKDAFSKNTMDFLYYQLSYLYDANPGLYCDRTRLELWKFFLDILKEFETDISVSCDEIPRDERDDGLVLVIISQYVDSGHAPTVTALDRCKILQETMGKRVLMINSSEAANANGMIPLIYTGIGNNARLESCDAVSWKGASIPYYQCSNIMPDTELINGLLKQVRALAPGRVVLIGGSSILGNLIDRMVPALTISTGFSDLAVTGTRYQAIGRKLTEKDEEYLREVGFDKSNVIEGTFTFDIRPQEEHVSRREFGISEDAFVMAAVSTRMDEEITEEFLKMLEGVLADSMVFAFLGKFSTFEERMEKFSALKDKCISLGFCEDVLSRLEWCDLYINPRRKGGGSSVVEAMYLGKPVVSIAYGDVALNAGEEFCVENYQEMADQILRYRDDKAYYAAMSARAKERAAVLMDTEHAFWEIMEEYDRRETERASREKI